MRVTYNRDNPPTVRDTPTAAPEATHHPSPGAPPQARRLSAIRADDVWPMRADWHDTQDPVWAEMLEAVPHDFYHLPGYVALCARQERARAKALIVRDGANAMLLPLLIRSIPGAGDDATSPYGYPGPLVAGPASGSAFFDEALRAGIEFLANQGLVSAFVRLHPLLKCDVSPDPGMTVEHGDTVVIDLSLPSVEHWAQTRAGHRYEIKRAVGAGFLVTVDDGWGAVEDFGRIYRQTMTRVSASEYYRFDDAYLDEMREALAGRLHLGVVRSGDTTAAAGLFVETSGIVQYHLSGTDARFSHYAPTKLLLHHMRDWAKQRGNRWFALGGGLGSENDTLFRFKAGFSPLRFPFRTLRLVLRPHEYNRLVQSMAGGGRVNDIGPAVTNEYFPAYRAQPRAVTDAVAPLAPSRKEDGAG
jgi:hypothetical protein